MQLIPKTEILIFQSTINVGIKVLYGKITLHFDREFRKMLVRGVHGKEDFIFVYVRDLLANEIKILSLNLTTSFNSDFNSQ